MALLDPRPVRYVLLIASVLGLVGCGPALRYRPADTMPVGTVEVGAGLGAAARADDGEFGGAELQAWIRGGAASRVEVGGRFWTYTLATFGGAFDFRAQPVRGPFDLTVDVSLLGGACCGAGEKNNTLAAAIGFDVGLSVGKRFAGPRGPAFYIAPHFQYSWVFPEPQDWPKQLFLPVGVDIPLGPLPIAIRPEFVAVALIHDGGSTSWRVGGGVAIALQPPSPKQVRERIAARKAARRAAEEEEIERMRKTYGLDRDDDE
jgi:hypothetical protein